MEKRAVDRYASAHTRPVRSPDHSRNTNLMGDRDVWFIFF